MADTYHIKLPQFEGPFDLLLFFIERDELDIYNIPVATIANDFLNYIHNPKGIDVELTGEFLLFAATLMRIKAKMLLPRREKDEQGNEIDPRQELVEKLIEYKKYKTAAEEMAIMEEERLQLQKRGNAGFEVHDIGTILSEGTEIQHITMFKLLQSYQKVLKRFADRINKPEHVVVKYNYSLEGQRAFLLETLAQRIELSFEQLFEYCQTRIHAIFTFLALLELVQQQYVSLFIGEGQNSFKVQWIAQSPQNAEVG